MGRENEKNFPTLRAEDMQWLANVVSGLGSPKAPEPKSVPREPSRPDISPVAPTALHDLLLYQKSLADKMLTLTNHSMVPEEIEFDSMPIYARIYSEDQDNLTAGVQFAEFIAYRDPVANEFAELMHAPMKGRLSVGRYMDLATVEAFRTWKQGNIFRFHEETIYGIQPEGIVKIVAQPWELDDERDDLFPHDPKARYVRSDLLSADLLLAKRTLGYFQYHIRDIK